MANRISDENKLKPYEETKLDAIARLEDNILRLEAIVDAVNEIKIELGNEYLAIEFVEDFENALRWQFMHISFPDNTKMDDVMTTCFEVLEQQIQEELSVLCEEGKHNEAEAKVEQFPIDFPIPSSSTMPNSEQAELIPFTKPMGSFPEIPPSNNTSNPLGTSRIPSPKLSSPLKPTGLSKLQIVHFEQQTNRLAESEPLPPTTSNDIYQPGNLLKSPITSKKPKIEATPNTPSTSQKSGKVTMLKLTPCLQPLTQIVLKTSEIAPFKPPTCLFAKSKPLAQPTRNDTDRPSDLLQGPVTSKNATKVMASPAPPTLSDDEQLDDLSWYPSTSKHLNPRKSNNAKPKLPKNVTQKIPKQPTMGYLHRKLSGIETLPTFIDGDRSIKTVIIYDHGTSVDMRGSKKLYKPRFGNADQIDTVILGGNGTAVSKLALNMINWSAEPSDCVRKVLATVFDREVLARSNLTGKGSPAFQDVDMPKKDKLDPGKVADITEFMLGQLAITAKDVRTAIVSKCADETKMLRKRLGNANSEVGGKENKQPSNKKRKTNAQY